MKPSTQCFLFVLACCYASGYSQTDKRSMVIGTLISKPNALLVLNPPDGNQGFLLPQITSTNRLLIHPSSPAEDGLIVYDITEKAFYFWKDNQWIKGLGGANQTISYDPLTAKLSLANGSTADLITLKEIPDMSGQSGKFLTTDGNTLSWATLSSLGDITSIIAGNALSGGGTSGAATLGVNTDNTTISVSASNQLQLSNNAVTPSKITPGANNTLLTTNASGQVEWSTSGASDSQTLSLAVNTLGITNGNTVNLAALTVGGQLSGPLNNLTVNANAITTSAIQDGTIITNDLANLSVSGAKISNATITSSKLNNTGVVSGTYGSASQVAQLEVDAQGRITNAANVTITSASPTGAAGGDLTGNYPDPLIASSAITTAKISDGAVTSSKLANTTVTAGSYGTSSTTPQLTIDAKGRVTNAVNLPITGVLPGGSAGGDLAGTYPNPIVVANAITTSKINDGAVTSSKLANTTVAPATYGTATSIPVLTIDAQGRITNASNVAISGVSPAGTAGGDLSGNYPNPTVSPGAITTGKIANAAVTSAKLANTSVTPSTYGGATSVAQFTVDAQGRITNAVDIPIVGMTPSGTAGGDLSGTYPNPSIATAAGPAIATAINNTASNGAIQGSKINANFGSQNITTNGTISITGTGSLSVAGNTTLLGTASLTNVSVAGTATFTNLGGGTNMVIVGPTGILDKQPIPAAIATGNLVTSTSGVSVTGGTNAVVGAGATINIQNATAAQPGLLSAADFSAFNAKIGTTNTPAAGDITGNYGSGFQIAAGAVGNNEVSGIATSKLLQGVATPGQLLIWDGTAWTPANPTVDNTTIAGGGVPADPFKIKAGGTNQVLITDPSLNVQWINQSALSGNLSASGDVSGALTATSVTKIRGVNVSAAAPADQQVLRYDQGTNSWIPATLSGSSASVAFKVQQLATTLSVPNLPTQLLWGSEEYDDGNDFSLSRFRVPSSGLYHFDVLVSIANVDKQETIEVILREGTISYTDLQRAYGNTGQDDGNVSVVLSTDVKLNTNDEVSVWMVVPSIRGTVGGVRTQFSGRKIY